MSWARACRWVWLLVIIMLLYQGAYMFRSADYRLEKLSHACDEELGVYNFKILCVSYTMALGCNCEPFQPFPTR